MQISPKKITLKQLQITPAKLTPRQWKLYEFLKTDTNHWFTPEEICEQIVDYKYNSKAWDKCPSIREDKKAINNSTQVEKLIVMKNRCFKIATYDEYVEERNAHIRRLISQRTEIENMDFKYNRDGQGKVISCQDKVIDENSKARPFVETFVRDDE